jgi:hypothetical protein
MIIPLIPADRLDYGLSLRPRHGRKINPVNTNLKMQSHPIIG